MLVRRGCGGAAAFRLDDQAVNKAVISGGGDGLKTFLKRRKPGQLGSFASGDHVRRRVHGVLPLCARGIRGSAARKRTLESPETRRTTLSGSGGASGRPVVLDRAPLLRSGRYPARLRAVSRRRH
jgi:hypothetical protein